MDCPGYHYDSEYRWNSRAAAIAAWNRRALPSVEEVAEALMTWRCADHSECLNEGVKDPTLCECRMNDARAVLALMGKS
jgi:hypothetical protein